MFVSMAVEPHLFSNEVEEGLAILHGKQRLGFLQAHGSSKPTVELQNSSCCEESCGIFWIRKLAVNWQLLRQSDKM
jgi:hypothetical protein